MSRQQQRRLSDLPDLAGSLFHNTDFTISVWANIDALKVGLESLILAMVRMITIF